jgi:hypothetical protein
MDPTATPPQGQPGGRIRERASGAPCHVPIPTAPRAGLVPTALLPTGGCVPLHPCISLVLLVFTVHEGDGPCDGSTGGWGVSTCGRAPHKHTLAGGVAMLQEGASLSRLAQAD